MNPRKNQKENQNNERTARGPSFFVFHVPTGGMLRCTTGRRGRRPAAYEARNSPNR